MVFSLFPDLLAVSIVAIALVRITVGVYFLVFGVRTLRASSGHNALVPLSAKLQGWALALAQLGTGFLFVVGLYTQGAALIGMALMVLALESTIAHPRARNDRPLYLLLFVLCVALLFLGAGQPAVDLPL